MISLKTNGKLPTRYSGFPMFAEWKACAGKMERWEQSTAALKKLDISADILQRVRALIKDAASAYRNKTSEPGKENEGLLLFKNLCEDALPEGSTNGDSVLESQVAVYDFIMDFAAQDKKVSQSWLRRLHLLLCRNQKTHIIVRVDKAKELPFRAGRYRRAASHMSRGKGGRLSGAPVKRTSAEMHKYCEQLRDKSFLNAHPVLQASYAHYALVLIHPFADGNGRIARALAFTFIYRSSRVPMLILDKDRGKYLSALRAADAGDFHQFINLVQESAVDATIIIKRSILSAIKQDRSLQALYPVA